MILTFNPAELSENEFASDENITREQMAAILQIFLESNK